jgi:hypothetical protein
MYIGKHFSSGAGIELSLFNCNPIDMEVLACEIIAVKALGQLFGLMIVLFGLEVSGSRATLSLLNCHLSVFWG